MAFKSSLEPLSPGNPGSVQCSRPQGGQSASSDEAQAGSWYQLYVAPTERSHGGCPPPSDASAAAEDFKHLHRLQHRASVEEGTPQGGREGVDAGKRWKRASPSALWGRRASAKGLGSTAWLQHSLSLLHSLPASPSPPVKCMDHHSHGPAGGLSETAQEKRSGWHRLRINESIAGERSNIKEKASGSKTGLSQAAWRGPEPE